MHLTRTFLFIVFSLLLSACSLFQGAGPWPNEIPPQQYFIDQYESAESNKAFQDQDNYLKWVQIFYQGSTLSPGWIVLSEELLLEARVDKRAEYKEKMSVLGRLIGAEWAKDNRTRLIDTRCASVWRNALLEAISLNDLDNYIARFEEDVNAILAGSLDKNDIQFERYYEEEEFEFF